MDYIFDIKSGHYKKLFEDEEQAQQPKDKSKEQEKANQNDSIKQFKSCNQDPEIIAIEKQMQDLASKLNNSIKTIDDQILKFKQSISGETSKLDNYKSAYNPAEVDNTILTLEQKKNQEMSNYYAKITNLRNQHLARRKALQTITEHNISQKYADCILNESKLNAAKLYLASLFNQQAYPDYFEACPNLHAFKKMFKESNLICGKDKNGYFAVCIDNADVDELADVLLMHGISKNDIVSCIMPQICDRSKFLQIG